MISRRDLLRRTIDEARKLVTVIAIIDSTHYSAAWRGQVYECRQFPSTGSLSAGDQVVCHVMPGTTELFSTERGALWFSPGHRLTLGGDLFKYTGGASATMLWTAPNTFEYITHLFFSRVDHELYCCTWDLGATPEIARIYRVNQSTGQGTEIASITDCDPIIDAAEHGSYNYVMLGGYHGSGGYEQVFRFDPVAGTLTNVLTFGAPACGSEWHGGIAVDPLTNEIVAADGAQCQRSPSGDAGSWVADGDRCFTESYDNFCLITNRNDDDLIYGGDNPSGAVDAIIARRTGAGAWVSDLNPAGDDNGWGVVAFTQEYRGATADALYAQRWAFYNTLQAQVWRKPTGGAWALDWTGPPGAFMGINSQGLAWFRGHIYALVHNPAFGQRRSRLYRRDAAGSWTLIEEYTGRRITPTIAGSSGMAVAPLSGRYCHEV